MFNYKSYMEIICCIFVFSTTATAAEPLDYLAPWDGFCLKNVKNPDRIFAFSKLLKWEKSSPDFLAAFAPDVGEFLGSWMLPVGGNKAFLALTQDGGDGQSRTVCGLIGDIANSGELKSVFEESYPAKILYNSNDGPFEETYFYLLRDKEDDFNVSLMLGKGKALGVFNLSVIYPALRQH